MPELQIATLESTTADDSTYTIGNYVSTTHNNHCISGKSAQHADYNVLHCCSSSTNNNNNNSNKENSPDNEAAAQADAADHSTPSGQRGYPSNMRHQVPQSCPRIVVEDESQTNSNNVDFVEISFANKNFKINISNNSRCVINLSNRHLIDIEILKKV